MVFSMLTGSGDTYTHIRHLQVLAKGLITKIVDSFFQFLQSKAHVCIPALVSIRVIFNFICHRIFRIKCRDRRRPGTGRAG